MQAYLYRTEKDLDTLIPVGAAVRLVKGAYNEPSEIAYPKKKMWTRNFLHLAQTVAESGGAAGRSARGTRDARCEIDRARSASGPRGREFPRNSWNFNAVRNSARGAIAAGEGRISLRVLISYGSYWFPWFMRRLAERPGERAVPRAKSFLELTAEAS